MAKGVKKIRWTGKGRVINNLSVPNNSVVIYPDQEVSFEIESWYDSTTEEEKKKNVSWILQEAKTRKEIAKKQMPSNAAKSLNIPKNLCGPYQYYLEASLLGSRDLYNQTGLIVRGECSPKIISSKWCQTNNGEDVRKTHFFSYGEKIYLNLKTEGLNGHENLSIDIFRRVSAKTNASIKRYTSVDVIDGEINLEINDSFSWYGIQNKQEVEEFYIQIFDPVNKLYIKDDNHDTEHARFLRIKNKIASMQISPPKNLSPLKTGEPAKNYMSYHFCKYTFIKMNDKMLFDEAKLIKGQKLSRDIYVHLFAGGNEKNKKVKIDLGEKIPGKCDNHKTKVFDITDLQKAGIQNPQRISANSFSFENNFKYKFEDDYRQFFTEYILPEPAAKAAIPLATCSYQHVLNIEMLPDVAWAYHFQYDKPDGGFFKDIDIKIQSGLKEELKYAKKYIQIAVKLSFNNPPDFINKIISDLIIDYLEHSSDHFGFGVHAYHSFDEQQKKPAVIMDYTAKYKWIARSLIITCVILCVVVDALILYLTRGRGAVATKAGRVVAAIDKYGNKVATIAKRKGFELITPKITSYRAQYYEKQPDGRIAFIQTEKVSALPLFGLQYEDKHTLGSIVTDLTGISTVFDYARKAMSIFGQITLLKKIQDKLNGVPSDPNKMPSPINTNDVNRAIDAAEEKIQEGIDKIAKAYKQELEFVVTIKGEYQADYQVFINHLTEAISIKDQLENYVNNSHGIVGRKKGIDAVASCKLKTGYHIKTEWIMRYAPNFIQGVIPVIDKETKAEGQAEIHGSLFYERKYFFEKSQSYYVDNVIFSGLAGSFSGSAKMKDNGKIPDSNNVTIPETSFVLMEPYVVKGERIYLFEKNTINEPK